MTAFADSSALVKLYVDEAGADLVRAHGFLVVSALVRVEVPAALWRKVRTGDLDSWQAGLLIGDFEADWYGDAPAGPSRFAAVPVGAHLLEAAARMAAVHALRAYDAAQLSTALAVRAVAPDVDVFACFDQGLRSAAAAEGFRVLPGG